MKMIIPKKAIEEDVEAVFEKEVKINSQKTSGYIYLHHKYAGKRVMVLVLKD